MGSRPIVCWDLIVLPYGFQDGGTHRQRGGSDPIIYLFYTSFSVSDQKHYISRPPPTLTLFGKWEYILIHWTKLELAFTMLSPDPCGIMVSVHANMHAILILWAVDTN